MVFQRGLQTVQNQRGEEMDALEHKNTTELPAVFDVH
jgi:hypothetical protein